ncbi:MAG TPA: NYN domain-containing protein [Streptosporangiaceae bacterium]|nr:NYN domain-containing protein [Streptosporangiaceae bacterium]
MDRCALFVDAGYVLADGAMAVHGTRQRESVSWDYAGLLRFLGNVAGDRCGIPLLRCYWYEAAVEGRRTPEHDALADLPGLKLRLGRMRPGRREGVETEIHRDLSTLARNHAISDAVIVSAEEDLTQVIADVQDLGLRITLIHIAVDGNWTISRLLRQECDAIVEVGGAQLGPYVRLLASADVPSRDEYPAGQYVGAPLVNGHGHVAAGGYGPPAGSGRPDPHERAPAIYTAPAHPYRHERPAQPDVPSLQLGTQPGGQPDVHGSQLGLQPGVQPDVQPNAQPGLEPVAGPGAQPPAGPQVPAGPPIPANPPARRKLAAAPSHAAALAAQAPALAARAPVPAAVAPLPSPTVTLADATVAAHGEGLEFGDSVARDAPALWLEAVLARKPRMPSDLEARLLQGSALPIDFLLHDEVRHALRRGFWDALERARR